jgi:hypothetical protein
VRDPSLLQPFQEQRTDGYVRDWFFLFYQVNAIFAMGLVGGPLVLWFAFRALQKRPPPSAAQQKVRSKKSAAKVAHTIAGTTPEQIFWRILIAAGLVLGVAVVGERDNFGVGHLTLLALQTVGLSMLAAVIPWRRKTLAIVLLAGCAVDFSCGVLLQSHVESLDNTAQATVFPGVDFIGGKLAGAEHGPDALSNSAWGNWFTKHQLAAYGWWLADLNRRYGSDPAFQAVLPAYNGQLEKVQSNDAHMWQGWFGRHGGEVKFIADHVAGWSLALQMLLVVFFLGLVGGAYWRTS